MGILISGSILGRARDNVNWPNNFHNSSFYIVGHGICVEVTPQYLLLRKTMGI